MMSVSVSMITLRWCYFKPYNDTVNFIQPGAITLSIPDSTIIAMLASARRGALEAGCGRVSFAFVKNTPSYDFHTFRCIARATCKPLNRLMSVKPSNVEQRTADLQTV